MDPAPEIETPKRQVSLTLWTPPATGRHTPTQSVDKEPCPFEEAAKYDDVHRMLVEQGPRVALGLDALRLPANKRAYLLRSAIAKWHADMARLEDNIAEGERQLGSLRANIDRAESELAALERQNHQGANNSMPDSMSRTSEAVGTISDDDKGCEGHQVDKE